ncbi:hypothetical protein ACJMK2_022292 [Sinanodonta woodiana]|uniref:BPTI/Kunitz inhibitor domain-containing protein n=1 Tax=Sinanodonta woodiana TaxID=1069815 RepID=A0ABD3TIR2_SINWO
MNENQKHINMYLLSNLLFLWILSEARSGASTILLDKEAMHKCQHYKMMCPSGKICAMQTFQWPTNMTFPVCVPLKYVPVRNPICEMPPNPGNCKARYIRWHFNKHSQKCSWFTYGGCHGNQNNFRTPEECEKACIPSPALLALKKEHESSSKSNSLVQVTPSVMSSPLYQEPDPLPIEALSSINTDLVKHNDGFDDRYPTGKQKTNEVKKNKGKKKENKRKRRRLNKEKKKRQLRRERRKERKRQKRLKKLKKNKTDETSAAEGGVSRTAALTAATSGTKYFKRFSILDKHQDIDEELLKSQSLFS